MQPLMAWALSFRMVCTRLDLTVQECLDAWRNRTPIVVIVEEREDSRQALVCRINEMYPF